MRKDCPNVTPAGRGLMCVLQAALAPFRRTCFVAIGLTSAIFAVTNPLLAQEKKPEKVEPPEVKVIAPLAVAPGQTVKLVIRGLKLDTATAVKVSQPAKSGVTAKIISKGKAEAKDDAIKKISGDTQVELELKIPQDASAGSLGLIFVTPTGDSALASLQLLSSDRLVLEKEPNGGLRQAQEIRSLPCTISGAIGGEKDVDLYRIAGKAGQTLQAQIRAARLHSALDASLTVYNAQGQVLGSGDDSPSADQANQADRTKAPGNLRDAMIDIKLPADGQYFVAVIDANDRGGATTHPYLLDLSIK